MSGEGGTVKMLVQAVVSSLFGMVFFGVLLFWPAGTFDYWQAWVFIAIFAGLSFGPTVYWALRRPDVLRRRMRAGPTAETRPAQKLAVAGTIATVVAMCVVSALDHRLGWSQVPVPVVVVGDVLVALGLGMAMIVVSQNSFAAATITVETEQTVVSTGLYGMVRHPMYVGALIMMAGMPLALDSYWGLVTLVPGAAVLALRIDDEEKMLRNELAGYDKYMHKVPYRLVPGLW
jgi:protein-S-isoprenylcysteine O-methyltransferase Ste14